MARPPPLVNWKWVGSNRVAGFLIGAFRVIMKPCSVAQGHGHFLPVFNDHRSLGFDFSCRGMVVYDQPRTALARKKCPDPLDKHADPEIGGGEELDVDQ